MSLAFCPDINLCFQLIMPDGNCAMYGCSSLRTTPGISLYKSNTGEEQHCSSYYIGSRVASLI